MRHEVKKFTKIVDEVLTYCMYTLDADDVQLSVKKTSGGFEAVILIHELQISSDVLSDLKKKLEARRNPELEDYYWQLTGEVEDSSELELVAMMCDQAEVQYDGDSLKIILIRKI